MELTIKDLGYQATAYENNSIIDYDNFIKNMILEELDNMDESELISLYNSYTYEEAPDDTFYENGDDFFNEYYSHDPMAAVLATQFGSYNYNDEYVRFNGYGNLDSFSDFTAVEEIKDNGDFIEWLYNNYIDYLDYNDLYELIEYLHENEEEITQEALNLVKKGY